MDNDIYITKKRFVDTNVFVGTWVTFGSQITDEVRSD